MSPLVSVIVPAWNAERTIDETLRSIRLQTHRALEILVVDDGSQDATAEIVARHARIDDRIHLISQPNGGVVSARNRGLAAARGEYVALIDSDDLWAPDKIARQLDAFAQDGGSAGACYTHFRRIDADGFDVGPAQRPRLVGNIARDLRFGNFIGHCSSILFRRKLIERTGPFDTRLHDAAAEGCEDLEFFLRLATVARFICVPELLTAYRVRVGSTSADVPAMLKSWRQVEDNARLHDPEAADDLAHGRSAMAAWMIARAIDNHHWRIIHLAVRRHGPGRLRLVRATWRAVRQRWAEAREERDEMILPREPFRAGYVAGDPAA